MSSKKKEAQAARRAARQMFAGYQEELSSKIQHLNDVLRKRPKYVPRALWKWGANIFIDIERIERPLHTSSTDSSN